MGGGDKTTRVGVWVVAGRGVLVEVCLPVPAFLRPFNDASLAVTQILPVGVDIDRLRIATAQPDNGDRFAFHWRAERSTSHAPETPARDQPSWGGGRSLRGHRRCLTDAIRACSKERS